MRFGRIYMLGEIEDYQEFTRQIKEALVYSNKINNNWLWKGNKPVKDPKEFLLSSIQDYITTLYNSGDEQLSNIRAISETVLKYYPNHVESLSNVALTYLINGDYDKALEYLLSAEKVAPKDVVVLNNIAEAYRRKKDSTKAKMYFEKVIRFGNKEEVQDAKEKMKNLQ